MITSLQNDRVKLVRALQTQPKARHREGKIALEGVRLIRDALLRGHIPEFVFYQEERLHPTLSQLLAGVPCLLVHDAVMRHVCNTQQTQGVIAVFPLPNAALPAKAQRVLILDSLRDPGNLGTILRTAAAAAVQAVLLSPDTADAYNPKTVRSGMGAHFRVALAKLDWARISAYCAGLPVYLADARGDLAYHSVDWSAGWALIISSEAHGASREARQLASKHVYIPMAGESESLNAAAAAAVLLFEAQRQGDYGNDACS